MVTDTDDDSYRPSKRTRARPPGSPGGGSPPTSPPRGGGGPRGPPSDTDDTDVPMTDAFEVLSLFLILVMFFICLSAASDHIIFIF